MEAKHRRFIARAQAVYAARGLPTAHGERDARKIIRKHQQKAKRQARAAMRKPSQQLAQLARITGLSKDEVARTLGVAGARPTEVDWFRAVTVARTGAESTMPPPICAA